MFLFQTTQTLGQSSASSFSDSIKSFKAKLDSLGKNKQAAAFDFQQLYGEIKAFEAGLKKATPKQRAELQSLLKGTVHAHFLQMKESNAGLKKQPSLSDIAKQDCSDFGMEQTKDGFTELLLGRFMQSIYESMQQREFKEVFKGKDWTPEKYGALRDFEISLAYLKGRVGASKSVTAGEALDSILQTICAQKSLALTDVQKGKIKAKVFESLKEFGGEKAKLSAIGAKVKVEDGFYPHPLESALLKVAGGISLMYDLAEEFIKVEPYPSSLIKTDQMQPIESNFEGPLPKFKMPEFKMPTFGLSFNSEAIPLKRVVLKGRDELNYDLNMQRGPMDLKPSEDLKSYIDELSGSKTFELTGANGEKKTFDIWEILHNKGKREAFLDFLEDKSHFDWSKTSDLQVELGGRTYHVKYDPDKSEFSITTIPTPTGSPQISFDAVRGGAGAEAGAPVMPEDEAAPAV